MKNRLIIVCLLFLNLQYFPLYAYEGEVHIALNTNTVNASNLEPVLKNQLGMSDGIRTTLDGFEELYFDDGNKVDLIWEWIAFGGVAEDFGKHEGVVPSLALFDTVEVMSTRAHNHFHDPLEDWINAGLNNSILNDIYNDEYGRDSVSTVIWGLNPGEQDFELNTTGDWSWGKAKESFYIYLTGHSLGGNTVASTESERNSYFAYCLRALGQVMHLLEDMSVPLHTRNDAHIFPLGKMKDYKTFWTYETYTAKNIDNLDYTVDVFDKPTQSLLIEPNPDPYYSDISPVSGLFDNNQYDGSTPLISGVGLAEYSNANFLTEDTMFSGFPYPNLLETEFNYDNWRLYLSNTGQGAYVEHLASVSYLGMLRKAFLPMEITNYPLTLDNACYAEYASFLIPRAVAYSAAMLDYFFRGEIEISAPEEYVYSIIDGSVSPQQFTYIKAKVRNNTSLGTDGEGDMIYEQMGSGTLVAVAKYKKRTNYEEDLSADPPLETDRESDFSYSVSIPIEITSLSAETGTDFIFDFSANPIPAGITDLYLQVIFKGDLGNENDVAVAVGMKDLNEPDHYTVFNNTDWVYFNGELMTATEVKEIMPDLICDPLDINVKLAFSSNNNYNATYIPLSPGGYGRIIVLTGDPHFYVYCQFDSYPYIDTELSSHLNGTVYQEDEEGNWQSTGIISDRGIISHWRFRLMWTYPYSPSDDYSYPILTAPDDVPVIATEIVP